MGVWTNTDEHGRTRTDMDRRGQARRGEGAIGRRDGRGEERGEGELLELDLEDADSGDDRLMDGIAFHAVEGAEEAAGGPVDVGAAA